MNQKIHAIIAGLLASALVGSAAADESAGPYFGVLIGQTDISRDITTDYTYSTSKFGYGLMAGWQLHPYFAVEAEYLRPNKISETGSDGTNSGTVVAKFQGISATGLLTYPLNDIWSVHARLGVIRAREHYKAEVNSDPAGFFSDNTTDVLYGAGIGVMFDRARIRLDYQRAEFDAGKFKLLSLGINWFIAH